MLKYYVVIVFSLLHLSLLQGQGWERIYSGGGQDAASDVVVSPDGGFAMTGYYGNQAIQLIKVNTDGFIQWSKTYPPTSGPSASGNAIIVTRDSAYVIGGYHDVQPPAQVKHRNAYLLKTDLAGNLIWAFDYGVAKDDAIEDVQELSDGSLVVCGYRNDAEGRENVWVMKTDANGVQQWSRVYGLPDIDEKSYGLTVADNGDIVVVGEKRDEPSLYDIYALRLASTDGSLIWEKTYGLSGSVTDGANDIVQTTDGNFVIAGFSQTGSFTHGALIKISGAGDDVPLLFKTFNGVDNLYDLALDGNGGFLITGYKSISAALIDLYISRTDANGNTIWENAVGKPGADIGYAVLPTPDGGSVAVGSTQPSPDLTSLAEYAYMVRTDANGRVFTHYLSGRIFHDIDENGLQEPGETGLEDWLLRIESPDFTRYATANAQGDYFILVDTGVYQLTLFTPNDYWDTGNTPEELTVEALSFNDTTTANVRAITRYLCPHNEVDIQTPILRRCADNEYTVRYCNTGTTVSTNTAISIAIDPFMSLTTASQPYTLNGDTAVFELGLLQSGECGSFTFSAFLDCNTIEGQAHCVGAHITPDTFCNVPPNWDGAIIEAKGKCENDTISFSLKNKGTGPTTGILDYVIIDDVVMLTVPPGQVDMLMPGEERTVHTQLANGHTVRIISEQTAGYPGRSLPTAAIEGCQSDPNEPISTGYFTMFPQDDAEPWVALDCQESYDVSFNPDFLKRGHPKGYEAAHFVMPGTDIDYLIRFVNTGADTAQQVVVRDTLSAWLNPTTVHPGASSHVYDYQLYGGGIAQFTLSNANLAPGQSGYVKFRVSQQAGVPCDVEITNTAAVYFDFNAPAVTNEVFHTICDLDSFVLVQTQHVLIEGATVKIYPNPFVQRVTVEVSGLTARQYGLELYDPQSRVVFNQLYSQPTIQLFRHQIRSGAYFYRLTADGKPVASGKLLVAPD